MDNSEELTIKIIDRNIDEYINKRNNLWCTHCGSEFHSIESCPDTHLSNHNEEQPVKKSNKGKL